MQTLKCSVIYEYEILSCQNVLTTMLHFPAKLSLFKGRIQNLFVLIQKLLWSPVVFGSCLKEGSLIYPKLELLQTQGTVERSL